jgi:hypothetical protein
MMTEWNGTILGPPHVLPMCYASFSLQLLTCVLQSVHENRIYSLRIICGNQYPDASPQVSFISKINLPCVNSSSGRVCHPLEAWERADSQGRTNQTFLPWKLASNKHLGDCSRRAQKVWSLLFSIVMNSNLLVVGKWLLRRIANFRNHLRVQHFRLSLWRIFYMSGSGNGYYVFQILWLEKEMRKDGWEDMDGRFGGLLSSLVVASTIVCFPIAHQVAMLLSSWDCSC